jgi:UDP-N-acetylglucosamine:LPS N-acetylglucosamine transferase
MAKKYGVNPKSVMVTGWWTRPEMYAKYDPIEARKKLGMSLDMPVIFVGGGSLGTNALPKILPTLLVVKKKMGIIFNSGTDKLGYRMVEEFAKWYKRIKRDGLVEIVNLGWIDNMAQVLSAADIVFGKAGPNFLFDVVAAKKPFVSITHIGGQEDGNIEIIKQKKLGWVKEQNGTLGKFLLEYLDKSEKFGHKYRETINQEAGRNEKTLERIWKEIEK